MLDAQLVTFYTSLPARTAVVILTGHPDPRRIASLNARKVAFESAINSGKKAENMDRPEWWEGVAGGGREGQAWVVTFGDQADLSGRIVITVSNDTPPPFEDDGDGKEYHPCMAFNVCLFQPFRTRSDRAHTLTVRNGGYQYKTWFLWDEFCKSPPLLDRQDIQTGAYYQGRRASGHPPTKHKR